LPTRRALGTPAHVELQKNRLARVSLGLALTAALLVCRAASASSAASGPPAQSEPKVWYGWRILAVDLLDAVLATAPAVENAVQGGQVGPAFAIFEVTAGVIYVAGGPIVHLAQRQGGRAAISFALRVGAPASLALGFWYIATALWPSIASALGGLGVGGGIGVLTASAIDIAVLARAPALSEPTKPADPSAQQGASLVLLPRMTTARDAGHRLMLTFGVAGTF
jgi:hypothetical protein